MAANELSDHDDYDTPPMTQQSLNSQILLPSQKMEVVIIMSDIERRIQFYQILWVKEESNHKRYVEHDLDFLNTHLAKIPMIETADSAFVIYLERIVNDDFNRENPDKSFWKISKIRKTDLPLKFNETNKTSHSLGLRHDEGLQEPAHFVIFSGKIIGAELNNNGPRTVTTLYKEINKHLEDRKRELQAQSEERMDMEVDSIEIKPIPRNDAFEQLNQMTEISSIMIKVATNYAKTLNNDPQRRDLSFNNTFSSSKAAEDMFIKIEFSVGRGRKAKPKEAFGQVVSDVKKMFGLSDCTENIESAKVRGREIGTDPLETVDLLQDYIMIRRNVTKINDETKAVDSLDMYRKILESYIAVKPDLERYSSGIER